MTVDKPQVGRTTIMDASDPDWISADVGATKEVKLTDGSIIKFKKTAKSGWVCTEQTKKERGKENMQAKSWCNECMTTHTVGAHIAKTTTGASTYASGNYNTNTYSQCSHDGKVLVYTCKNGAKLYGSGKYNLNKHMHDVIIDMAGNVKTNFICGGNRKFHALKKYVSYPQPEILNLDWEDYGVPPVTFRFWIHLLELLADKDVTLTCWGGHGRTGTAMAALMIADGVPPIDAMRHIWKVYCEKAVETTGQENYLFELVGEIRPDSVPVAKPATTKTVVHSSSCRCTACMAEIVASMNALYAKDKNEEEKYDQTTYLHGARTEDEEWERYQQWARSHTDKTPEVYDWNIAE